MPIAPNPEITGVAVGVGKGDGVGVAVGVGVGVTVLVGVASGVAVRESPSTKLQPLTSASRIAPKTKEKALGRIALIRSPLMVGIGYWMDCTIGSGKW